MECLAVIPARGGSKGIPNKNIRILAGKPLIAHSIEQALQSKVINKVVVSTDSPEIGAISNQCGAEVIWRPDDISGDKASSEGALLHVLETLRNRDNYEPDIMVFLQCTSPLTITEDIDGTIKALLSDNADTALSVAPFHYYLWRLDADTRGNINAIGINHNKQSRPLRQEREPQYIETGAVYVMRVQGFLQTRHRFFGKTSLYIMPNSRRLEIDDLVDLKTAEVLMQDRKKSQIVREKLPHPIHALIMDFDGVFTDNRVIVFQDGSEAVICDRSDGWGIAQLKKYNIPLLILSTETNPVVKARSKKLGIQHIQGFENKWQILQSWLEERKYDPEQVIYLGNDVNDLECIEHVGCSIAVADAHPDIINSVDIILKNPGGQGAIRELCDLIIDHHR